MGCAVNERGGDTLELHFNKFVWGFFYYWEELDTHTYTHTFPPFDALDAQTLILDRNVAVFLRRINKLTNI